MDNDLLLAWRYVDDLFCYISDKYNLRKESPLGANVLKEFIPRRFTENIAALVEDEEFVNGALDEARMFDFDFHVFLNAGCYRSYYLYGFCQRLHVFRRINIGALGVLYTSALVSQLCVYCVLMNNMEAVYDALCVLIGILQIDRIRPI